MLGQRDRALPLVWELFEFNPSNYEYFDYLCESELGYKTPAEVLFLCFALLPLLVRVPRFRLAPNVENWNDGGIPSRMTLPL